MPGPCTDWISGDDVADCCSVETSSGAIFDEVAATAQEVLFELSGRQFAGECSKTVRPCRTNCGCGWQILSRGHIVGPWDLGYWSPYWYCDDMACGCMPISQVKLSGYPVREITEILIDGVAIAATEYRLDKNRYVTRTDNGKWPGCQNMTLANTEVGTWSIEYTYGADVPSLGISAAAQLACELYKACQGQDCALPTGVTRITRQGVTVEKLAFTSWAFQRSTRGSLIRGWRTGMPLVDLFLATYNPDGYKRRPIWWAPSMTHRYAPTVGP